MEMYINQNKLGEASKVGDWLKSELGQSELYEFPCLISLGNLELAKKNYAAAEKCFRGALKARGSIGAWGWLGLARSELYQEHFGLAAQYANKALAANRMKTIENNDTTFHPEYLYPILTTAAASQKKRAPIEALIEEHAHSMLYGAPLSPALLNGLDMSIASTELHKAGFDDLVPRMRNPIGPTWGLYNPISTQ